MFRAIEGDVQGDRGETFGATAEQVGRIRWTGMYAGG